MAWTKKRTELLKKYWADGLSATRCADEIGGVSRNAVIGKVNRLGLEHRQSTQCAERGAAAHYSFRLKPMGGTSRAARLSMPRRSRPLPRMKEAPPAKIANPSRLCRLLELSSETCRWPMWTDNTPHSDQFYCGAKPGEGMPYCAAHARIAYNGVPDMRRAPSDKPAPVMQAAE